MRQPEDMASAPQERPATYLRRLKVKGFKSLADVDIELRPLNVLIGANGSGKSNVLDFLDFMGRAARGRMQETVRRWGGPHALLWKGNGELTQAEHVEWEMELEGPGDEAEMGPRGRKGPETAEPDARVNESFP